MLRDINSLSDKETLIQDKVLEPFFITRSPLHGYSVYQKITNKKGKKVYRNVAYSNSFEYCLQVIIREQCHHPLGQKYNSLEEYIGKWREVTTIIMNTMKEFNSL